MCVSGRMPENFIRIDREYSEWQVFLAGGRGDKSNFSVLTGQYCMAHTLGWSGFERKKCYTLYVVSNGCRTSIPHFHVFMFYFHLSQGFKKCWVLPKMRTLPHMRQVRAWLKSPNRNLQNAYNATKYSAVEPVHPIGPFQVQNCIKKRNVNHYSANRSISRPGTTLKYITQT